MRTPKPSWQACHLLRTVVQSCPRWNSEMDRKSPWPHATSTRTKILLSEDLILKVKTRWWTPLAGLSTQLATASLNLNLKLLSRPRVTQMDPIFLLLIKVTFNCSNLVKLFPQVLKFFLPASRWFVMKMANKLVVNGLGICRKRKCAILMHTLEWLAVLMLMA